MLDGEASPSTGGATACAAGGAAKKLEAEAEGEGGGVDWSFSPLADFLDLLRLEADRVDLTGDAPLGVSALGGGSTVWLLRYASIAASREPCFETSSFALASLRSGNMPAKRFTCSASAPPPPELPCAPPPPEAPEPPPPGLAHFFSTYLAWMNLRTAGSSESRDTPISLPFQAAQSSSFSFLFPPAQILSASAAVQFVMVMPLTVRPTSLRKPAHRVQTKL
mmetsp:Transcript_50367/g.155721  ORF Transcript_50367/g.155721 Transcript_50367/m.155721 type:complete len:222 (+) Transcript_50367:571-1236(+)